MPAIRLSIVLLSVLCVCAPVSAADFCVTNNTQLQNALATAAGNGQSNIIRIATGLYQVPAGGFVYDAQAGGNNQALNVSGGWTPFFDNPCGQQLAHNPLLTVLDGNDSERILRMTLAAGSDVSLRLLFFINGNAGSGRGGALSIRPGTTTDYSGSIDVESNVFIGNQADYSGAVSIVVSQATDNATVRFINNAVVNNTAALGAAGGGELVMNGGAAGLFGAGLYVINNTVINNHVDDEVWSPGGLWVAGSVPQRVVANNNLWGNTGGGGDYRVALSSGVISLINNNIGTLTGTDPDHASGNISVQPEYETCYLCFQWVPVIHSPLVDAGRSPDEFSNWSLPEYDLAAQPRVNTGRVDIGAYENHTRLFADRFEQAP